MTTYCEFKFSLFLVIITIFIFRNKETKKKHGKIKYFLSTLEQILCDKHADLKLSKKTKENKQKSDFFFTTGCVNFFC